MQPDPEKQNPAGGRGSAAKHATGQARRNSTTVADVLGRLEGVHKTSTGWSARCPAHNDRNASLSIAEGDTGRPLLFCHAGCTFEAIAAALGIGRGDFAPMPDAPRAPKPTKAEAGELVAPIPADAPPMPSAPRGMPMPSAHWTYRDAEGRELFAIFRFDLGDGKKEMRPLTLWSIDGVRRWKWKGYPTPRPLYGLEKLAARPDAPVLIVEGEKAADAAALLLSAFVAITSPGGSANAKHASWIPLAGRSCTIWPDADEPGAAYAADVERLLREAGAAAVSHVELAALV